MSDNASLTSGIAGRYAQALFEIAKEARREVQIEADLDALAAILADSAEMRDLISSPVYTRADQGSAMAAIGKTMGLCSEVTGTVGLMASKRRLFVLPQLIEAVKALMAEDRGEVSADVVSARPLSADESKALAATLKTSFGKDVTVHTSVDKTLIGGLIVKVGSKMLDTSIRSKLSKLQNVMKEAG